MVLGGERPAGPEARLAEEQIRELSLSGDLPAQIQELLSSPGAWRSR